MTLYEMTGKYRELEDVAATGEWDDTSGAVLDGLLAKLEGDIEQKLLNIARIRANMRAESEAIKSEEERLAKRRKSLDNSRDRLEEYAREQMEYVGIHKVSDAAFTVAMQKNPPSVNVLDESKIDARWWIPQPAKLDKQAIKKALQDGADVHGAELVQTRGVRFR